MIDFFAKFIPDELMEKSGSVFYSGRNAFSGNKPLYILGLNPGGSEIRQNTETIKWHTERILKNENHNFSEYKDGIWRGKKAGTSKLQLRILYLLNVLNLDASEIPASNVCFVRSPREIHIADYIKDYMNSCWSLHQNVIDKLEVKTILCLGKTAGNYVRLKLGANILIDEFVEDNDRKWKTQVYRNDKKQIVIVATHPSIADWTNKKTDISELVKKYI